MFLAKLKVTSIALLLACVTAVGTAALTTALTLQAAQGQPHQEGGPPRAPKAGAPNAAAKAGSAAAISNGAARDAKPAWREMLTMKHEHAVTAIACSSNWTAVGDEGGTLFAWDTKTGKNRTRLGKTGTTVDRLQFTADGKYLYTIGNGGRGISRWIPPWKDKYNGIGFMSDAPTWIGVSPDGDTWLMPEKEGRQLGLQPGAYSRPDGEGRFLIPLNALDYETVKYEAKVSHALLSADHKWLAVVTKDGTLHIHDRASLQETHTIAAGKEGVVITDVQFSADGKRIALSRDDALAKIYDTAKGEEVATLKGHSGIVFAVAFSPDGKRIVTGGDDNTARVWDAATGRALATLDGHTDSVRCAAFDPSGEILLTGSADKTMKLWKLR